MKKSLNKRLTYNCMLIVGGAVVGSSLGVACLSSSHVIELHENHEVLEYGSEFFAYVFLVALFAIFLSWLMAQRLSKRILHPLEEMQDIARAMASGDYSRRVTVFDDRDDEVTALGETLNSLASELDKYVDKMKRIEKIRKDFVVNVSHELRTPVTIIRGYNEALKDGLVSNPEMVNRYRTLIDDETIRLERMVRELMNISKLQSCDELPLDSLEPLPVRELMDATTEQLTDVISKRHVKIDEKIDESIKILGNGDQLAQLLAILTDNALKYSSENGTVFICAEKLQDGGAVISVTDEGPGIPEEEIPLIWERFYKVEKSHCRNSPGTGLGLAIAKEIIRMHGAKAEVISKCGVGTTFEIKFPKDKVV